MHLRRGRSLIRRLPRLLAVGFLMVSYLIATIGFPLPVRAAPPEASQANTPGAVHICGCAAEDRCAGTCCCCKPQLEDPEPEQPSCCGQPPAPREPAPLPGHWVIGEAYKKCRGLDTTWLSLAAVLPTALPLDARPEMPCRGWVAEGSVFPQQQTKDPAIPPPRPGTGAVDSAPVPDGGMSAT